MKTPKSLRGTPPMAAGLPAVIDPLQRTGHSHRSFHRAARFVVEQLSGGISMHATFKALSDWAQYVTRALGRQMELAEHALPSLLTLAVMPTNPGCTPPFAPKPYDHHFDYEGWQKQPFQM